MSDFYPDYSLVNIFVLCFCFFDISKISLPNQPLYTLSQKYAFLSMFLSLLFVAGLQHTCITNDTACNHIVQHLEFIEFN